MYSIAYKYVSDILTVDDIVQDSIVSLYGKIDILKPMPDKVLAGYIVSTVRNTAINRLRVKEYEKDHIAEFTEELLITGSMEQTDDLVKIAQNIQFE